MLKKFQFAEITEKMDNNQFLDLLGTQHLHDIRPNEAIKAFTTNPAIIGNYAEESIRCLVRRTVSPLRVSTGAVIDPATVPDSKLRQIDTIVWTPCPSPAVFDVGNFGLIPRGSSMGILEIKRSLYSGVSERLSDILDPAVAENLVAPALQCDIGSAPHALGVICLKEEEQTISSSIKTLCDQGRLVILLEMENGVIKERQKDLWTLINFLTALRLRARHHEGSWMVRYAEGTSSC